MTNTPLTITRLGKVQREEVAHGLDVDADDENPEWGHLDGATLTVTNPVGFVYRMTSSADIADDNLSSFMAADDAASYRVMLRSCVRVLERGVAKFDDEDWDAVEAAGFLGYLARHGIRRPQ